MRCLPVGRIVGWAAFLLVPATAAHADALQERLLAGMRATRSDGFAFRQTTTIERSGADRKTLVEQYDPRRAEPDRWSLASVDGHAPTPKDLSGWRKIKRDRVPSYGENTKWFAAPATRVDANGVTTYRFARLPAGTLKIGPHDASADAQAEVVVNTRGRAPFVERVRFVTNKPFRIMLVASVQNLVADARYTSLANGAVVPAEVASRTAGSLMGKSGTLATRTTFDQVQPVR
ncbi:hypothetical protein [Sphingomonas citricola]|uniref:hypothetical protein n=1 Tax=Sphingomonas citricola TaxID=2862498 RepID=UPI0027E50F5D|nr:hypothetical protein [Sphingomonas citricola]